MLSESQMHAQIQQLERETELLSSVATLEPAHRQKVNEIQIRISRIRAALEQAPS
ncbi:MAG: hypothetical protein AB7V27_19055 [Candidatus Binatia bacterium]